MQVIRCFNAIFEMAARMFVDVIPVRRPSLQARAFSGSGLAQDSLTGPRIGLGWLPGWLSSGPHLCDLDQDLSWLAVRPTLPRPRVLDPSSQTWIHSSYASILSGDTPRTLSQLPHPMPSSAFTAHIVLPRSLQDIERCVLEGQEDLPCVSSQDALQEASR